MKLKNNKNFSEKVGGFTLIETLVVISILVLLASILLTYSGGVRSTDSLVIETNKIAQIISLAKSKSIETFGTGATCGYGVYFNYNKNSSESSSANPSGGCQKNYCLFYYKRSGDYTECDKLAIFYPRAVSGNIFYDSNASFDFDPNVQYSSSQGTLGAILFVPPAPRTIMLDSAGTPISGGSLNISTLDRKSQSEITISSAGQITTSLTQQGQNVGGNQR